MTVAFVIHRTTGYRNRELSIPKRRSRKRWPFVRKISRRLAPTILYGVAVVLFLGTFCSHLAFNSSLTHVNKLVLPSTPSEYPKSDFTQQKGLLKSPSTLKGIEHLKEPVGGVTTKEEIEEIRKSYHSRSPGPPSYLPLAQHLRYVNYKRSRISLRDMVFGAQKRTYPDLEPTDNFDLLTCEQCSRNCKGLGLNIPNSDHELQLARLAVRLITFYNFSSMLVFPCEDEIHWILPLNAAIQQFNPNFEMYCAVSNDKTAVDMMKKYDRGLQTGSKFVVYQPMKYGYFPKVDVWFTWRGLEQYSLEAIQEVFKEAIKEEIKTVLVGNSPAYENAKVVETGTGTFSVKRALVRGLNVRAYPFGFNKAIRVFPLVHKQLLFYNTSTMRDGW